MAGKRPNPIDRTLAGGEPDRYVFVEVPRIPCPRCQGERHHTTRTERCDGNKAHRKSCRDCGHSFIVVYEPAA